MTWIDDILKRCEQPILINDSKTPSGTAHVGSLRGVLIHDALARVARSQGLDARFTYGCDDMDPVDEIPHGTGDYFVEHLGKPLHAAPAPPGMEGENMARAYFGEFTATFEPLGVNAEFYFMSEIYASGALDDTIDTFLRGAAAVREIYRRETGAQRTEDWLPFQVICDECGRIGTTYVTDYDGATVAYECRPDLVQWAQGCGATGRKSPFGGNGKLPWKLEWAAKWKVLPVTVEGAGKDHMGAGGSYQVSAALAREVLATKVPKAFAYEFFTLGGAKMSSSKGIGMSAGELAQMLPGELLRYLVLRTQPRRAIDFVLDMAGLNGAFGEYERLWRAVAAGDASAGRRSLFDISATTQPSGADLDVPTPPEFSPPFDSVVSIVSQPHIKLADHLARLDIGTLSEADLQWLEAKRSTAVEWSQRFTDAASRLTVRDQLPAEVDTLSNQQRAFLVVAGNMLHHLGQWNAPAIQGALFDAARVVAAPPAEAFEGLYVAFFGWPEGPRAGTFLEFLGKTTACERLSQVDYSYVELVEQTAVDQASWQEDLSAAAGRGDDLQVLPVLLADSRDDEHAGDDRDESWRGVVEVFLVDQKGRMSATRTVLEPSTTSPEGKTETAAAVAFAARAKAWAAAALGVDPSTLAEFPYNPFATAGG